MDTDSLVLFVIALAALAGTFFTVVPILPGTLFIPAGALVVGLVDADRRMPAWAWVVQAILVVVYLLVDNVAQAVGVKRVGGSRSAMVGGAIGVFVGPLLLAFVAGVPTHGSSTPSTGGRSASLIIAGVVPDAGGGAAAAAGVAVQAPASGSEQRLWTAWPRRVVVAATDGSSAGEDVAPCLAPCLTPCWGAATGRVPATAVVSMPVRATPTAIVRCGRVQSRSSSTLA